jgi:hypothetical protein
MVWSDKIIDHTLQEFILPALQTSLHDLFAAAKLTIFTLGEIDLEKGTCRLHIREGRWFVVMRLIKNII